jgi:hypothetical protein
MAVAAWQQLGSSLAEAVAGLEASAVALVAEWRQHGGRSMAVAGWQQTARQRRQQCGSCGSLAVARWRPRQLGGSAVAAAVAWRQQRGGGGDGGSSLAAA